MTVQQRAENLINELAAGGEFIPDRSDSIFSRIDHFIADGDDKDKLMGCILKAYIRKEWENTGSTREGARQWPIAKETLQRLAAGEFRVLSAEERMKIVENPALKTHYAPWDRFDRKAIPYCWSDVRPVYILHVIINDTLTNKLHYGEEGAKLAASMTPLLETSGDFTKGPLYLMEEMQSAHIAPFKNISIAEIGGDPVDRKDAPHMTLVRHPFTRLFDYKNVGGSQYTYVEQENLVSIATLDRHFHKQYDYVTTSDVLNWGSGMGSPRSRQEEVMILNLFSACSNLTKKDGIMIHSGCSLIPELQDKPLYELLGLSPITIATNTSSTQLTLRKAEDKTMTAEQFARWHLSAAVSRTLGAAR